MSKISSLLLIIMNLLLSISLSKAGEYGEFISCDGLNPEPRIIFKSSYGQLVHDISTPQKEIQSHSSQRPEKGFLIDGLATVEPQGTVKVISAQGITLDENNYCVLPREIEIYFGYQNPTIYVSKEYDRNSCRFSLIIRHEQTHQRINILTLQYFLPLFAQSITKAINEVKSVKVSSPEDAKTAILLLQKYYIAKITPIMEEFEKARNQEQMKLDNQTNYAMEINLCNQFDQLHQPEPKTP